VHPGLEPEGPVVTRVAVFGFFALFAAGCSKEAPEAQRPAPVVTVMTVTPQAIPYIVSFVAQTESSRQVDIVARVSGFLDRIAYPEGELVKEGQLLFQLDRSRSRRSSTRPGARRSRSRRGIRPRRRT